MAKGCEWNNKLAKENFQTNVNERGVEYAKTALRTDIHHWMAKREGREIPKWKATLDSDGHFVVDNQRLVDLTRAPLVKKVDAPISNEVKALVPIEVEAVHLAETQANNGAKKIYIPEHAPGGIRYVTVYTQSDTNPREYIGSQIDLGENLTWDKAKERIQTVGAVQTKQVYESRQHKEAFVFVEKAQEIQIKQKPFVTIANESISTPTRVLSDVGSTAVSVGFFVMEAIRRRRAQKQLEEKLVSISQNQKSTKKNERIVVSKKEKKNQIKRFYKFFLQSRFVAETGVGVGGVLFIMKAILHKEKSKQKIKLKERSRRKKLKQKYLEKKEILFQKKEKKREKIVKTERGKYREIKRKMKTKVSESATLSKKKRKRSLSEGDLLVKTSEKKKNNRKKDIWRTLVKLARQIKREPMLFIRTEKKKRKVVERQLVARFAFAWVLWFATSKNFHLSIDRNVKKKRERVVKKEPTQWVLLSIIWYLNAIREQGKLVVYKKQKKKKRKQAIFPQKGVIFMI